MKIAAYDLPSKKLWSLPEADRNLLFSLMLAHNELSTLNKLLMYSIKTTLDDALGEATHIAQTFTILKLLAGKLHETWKLVTKYYTNKLDKRYDLSADIKAKEAFRALTAYFKGNNVIKVIRDNAAFHYSGFDYGKALKELADGEEKVYLAQHPANTLYYVGEAVNWRALIQKIRDIPEVEKELSAAGEGVEDSIDSRNRSAFNVLTRHVNDTNGYMHALLYGLIKSVIDKALGEDWANTEHEMISILGAPNPYDVAIPTLINIEAAQQPDNSG